MTSIWRGLNVGDEKSWAAVRMVVTLGTPELGEETLGATPTPAGTDIADEGLVRRLMLGVHRSPSVLSAVTRW